ncbi:MAG: phosphatidate cytidylyltransferase [Prevotella sp.]|nr:phosphatidate cytidylyltransferase [Prevotella sp.]
MTDKKKNFIIRTITGIVFVAVMVYCLLNPITMVVLFALITALSIWELCGLVNRWDDIQTNQFICSVAGAYFFFAIAGYCTGYTTAMVFIPYLFIILYLIIIELFTKAPNPINNWAYTMFSQMYIALPLSTINLLAFSNTAQGITYDCVLPLSIFVFLWLNDTGAYCVGSLIGKHKLFPRVSPGKSWEGSIGGCVLVLIVAGVVGWLYSKELGTLSVPVWMGLGLVVVVFGTLGDLVESLLKRTLGVKDSGNLLPGHGGMLDRFDSSLMAIPAAVIYLYTLSMF